MRPLSNAVAWGLLVLLAPAMAQDPEPPDPKAGKQNGPLKVRLVARKSSYVLDRQGMTAEKYREAARAGNLAPPAVDLVLELTNTSKQNVTVRVSGSTTQLMYTLTGPAGAVLNTSTTKGPLAKGGKAPPIRSVVLQPGQKHEIAITSLDNTAVGRPRGAMFWSEAGAYTLRVDLRTSTSGFEVAKAKGKAKKGGVVNPNILRITTLESQPVKLTVKLK